MAKNSAIWQIIEDEYVKNNISIRKLAKKYGVSATSINTYVKEHSLTSKRAEYENTRLDEIRSTMDFSYRTLEDTCKRLVAKINERIECMGPYDKPQDIKAYMSALKDAKEILSYKSPLEIEEIRARIEKLKHDTTTEEVQDITIKIEGADDYAD